VVLLVSFKLADKGRTGANQAHISLQHIEKLGKFVDAGAADELTHAGFPGAVRQDFIADDPGIEIQLEHQVTAMLVQRQQFLFSLLRVQIHTAELIHLKMLSVLSDPLLGKENGTGRTEINHRTHKEDQQAADQAAHQSAGNVHGPLQEGLSGGGIVHAAGKYREISHLFHDLDSAGYMGDLIQIQVYRHAHFHEVIHQFL